MLHSEHHNYSRATSAVAAAFRRNRSYDASRLTPEIWKALSSALVRESNDAGTDLILEGENDGSLLFLESGLLRVYSKDKEKRVQQAVIVSGSVVGEAGFFAPSVGRGASVETMEPSTVWRLTSGNFEELAAHEPQSAVALIIYAGAVMRARMLNPARRPLIV